jgi:hypothetical protein
MEENEILLFAGKWIELKVILYKISQTEKGKYSMSSYHMQNLDLEK